MFVVTPGGETIEIGTTETAPTIGIVDYSRRVTDDFGVTTVVERGFARRMSVRLAVPADDTDAVQRRLADLRATSALWIADDRFASLSVQGFYKDFSLDLAASEISYCTLTVEGLAEVQTAPDDGSDASPDDQLSTLRLIQPIVMNDAALIGSSVPEDDYPEWQAGTTYAARARVIKAATHRVYESASADNIGSDPAGPGGKWIDIGPTVRWAMFDQALGTATTAINELVVTIEAGAIAGAVALLDVSADTVRVEAAGYDRTIPAGAGAVTFLDLPVPTGRITVTITGGQISIGTLLVGSLVSLGITEAAPSAGITDYSRKVVDDFGEVTVVERAFAKRMTARALIRTDAVDSVAGRITAVRARPSLWIGQAGIDSLTVYGFFKDFSIEVGETVSKLSLTIEGLSKAPPLPKPLTSVVAQGSADGVNWHLGLQPGDVFLRISNDSGVTFGEGIRVVGRDGTSAFTAYLTNAQHTLPATFDGAVTSYAGAETVFVIGIGGLDLTDSGQFDLSFPGNPQNLTIVATGRHFRVTGGFDASEDNASITARLTGKGQYAGVVVEQVFSLSKSKGGANGEPPPLIKLDASALTLRAGTDGNYIPGQSFVFTATRINLPGTTWFLFLNSAGDVLDGGPASALKASYPSVFDTTGPDNLILTPAGAASFMNSYGGAAGRLPIRAYVPGFAVTDTVTIQKVQDGAKGADAPLIKTQWSINGVDGWHDNFFGADQYYRQSNDNGLTYGPPIRGVGEGGTIGADGTSATHVFRQSPTMPAAPADNSGNPPSGWSDGPPGGPGFLWLSKASYRGSTQVTSWSAPQRISGADGQNAITAILTNETFTVPTDAAGAYAAFPIDVSRGQMRVYDGVIEVTAQCTFTYQHPYYLATYIDATGAYYSDYLGADTGYADLIASYKGVAYAARITASKVKGGARGTDGINPPLVSVSANPQAISYNRDDAITSGAVVFTATLQNAIGPVSWASSVGHGIYGTPGVTFSGNTMTISAARMADVLAYNLANFGAATETIIASASGASDRTTVTKVKDGAKGADSTVPGPTGADGFIVAVDQANFLIPVFSSGAVKPGWNGGSVLIQLTKGGARITAGVTYAVYGAVNIAGLAHNGGDTPTFAGLTADTGYFYVRAAYNGVNYDRRIDVKKVYDGSSAFRGSSTGSLSQANFHQQLLTIANGSTPILGGASVRISGLINYGPPYSSPQNGNFVGRMYLYVRNATDNGPKTLLGSTVGTLAYNYNDGTVTEPGPFRRQSGSVSGSFTFAAAAADKIYEYSMGMIAEVEGFNPQDAEGTVSVEVLS